MQEGQGFRPLPARNGELGPELVFECTSVERQPALIAAFPYRNMNTAIRYLHGSEASKLERFFCRVVKQEGRGWVMVSQGPRSIQRLQEDRALLRKLQSLGLPDDEAEGPVPGEEIEAAELEPEQGLTEGAGEVNPGPSLDEQTRAAIVVATSRCPRLHPVWLPVVTALTRSQAEEVRSTCPWVMASIVPLYDITRVLSSLEEGYLAHFMSMAIELARVGVRKGYEFNASVVVAAEKRRAVGGAYSLQRPRECQEGQGGCAEWNERRQKIEDLDLNALWASRTPEVIAEPVERPCDESAYSYAGDAAEDLKRFADSSEVRFSLLLHAARNAIRVKAMMPIDDYLLTGYDVFSVREPCIMCAMSLIHSRIRTLFYCLPRKENGGANASLSVPQLKNVNHRYTVVHLKGLEEFLR